MMITPVGVGYLFRMLADTNKGPLVPFFEAFGLQGFAVGEQCLGRAHCGDDRRHLAVDAVHVHRVAGCVGGAID